MTLIKSISGIRGTIGGSAGDNLNPADILRFTAAYALFIKESRSRKKLRIVVGRDARLSGDMVRNIVTGTLMGMGCDVIDIGLATTPTTELAVIRHNADGGIIITASHNPRHWNALKLLNAEGEFLTAADGARVLALAETAFIYADVDNLGTYTKDDTMDDYHINKVVNLSLVNADAIRSCRFRVCLDTINSVGGIILPKLLDRLGVTYDIINGKPTGDFAHNPEPLEKNLTAIMTKVREGQYDCGIVVDPDVDRLAFVDEHGSMIGEEYTLVSVADYVLSHTPGSTVSNLSSSRALRDVTERHGGQYSASAVGEVNVTTRMKEVGAIIGGEGNGGVIYPECHYGRDALVGIALFLSLLAERDCTTSEVRSSLPSYHIAKNRLDLTPEMDVKAILAKVARAYQDEQINTTDGVKIDFADGWVHLRPSNTEPIIRIYSEASTATHAEALAERVIELVRE